jgi:hypothetical protein
MIKYLIYRRRSNMKKYKDALIESVVTPSVDNAELY